MQKISDIKKSVVCALKGIFFIINKERNFRIHIVFACYVLYFSRYYVVSRSKTDFLILLLTIALVMCLEVVNTAIEEIVDHISPRYSLFAKNVKDIAAGGVLIAALFATLIGVKYFGDIKVICFLFKDIFFSFRKILCLFFSLLVSVLFVFKNKNIKNNNRYIQ